jgi:hypothetical protein
MRNGCLMDPNDFENELPFVYEDIKHLQKLSE